MAQKIELSITHFIQKAGEDWKEKLLNCIHEEEENGDVGENLENEFDDLCNAFKEILMQENEEALQLLKDRFAGELTVFNSLEKHVKENMFAFYFTTVLREKAKQSLENAIYIVDIIYQHFILRNNPDFFELYTKKLGFETQESLEKLTFIFDSITEFVIEKNYTQTAISEMIESLTRLDKELCSHTAKKIDDHFQELQMKIILQKLGKQNS